MSEIVVDSLILLVMLSLVPMVCIAVGAGLVAMLQAITQVQEQSLTHLVRVVVLAGVVFVGAEEAFEQLKRSFLEILSLASKM